MHSQTWSNPQSIALYLANSTTPSRLGAAIILLCNRLNYLHVLGLEQTLHTAPVVTGKSSLSAATIPRIVLKGDRQALNADCVASTLPSLVTFTPLQNSSLHWERIYRETQMPKARNKCKVSYMDYRNLK